MDVADYKTAIRYQLGLTATDPVLSDDVILWALNGSLKTIATDKNWPWLYTEQATATVANQATLPLPADFTRTIFITVDGQAPIEASNYFSTAHARSVPAGRPSYYTVDEDSIRLFPAPSEAFDVVHAYYRTEPELVNNADVPLLPDAYSEWLVLEASVKCALRTNHTARLVALKDELVKVRKGIIDAYHRAHSPSRIRRTRPSIWPVET